jgi:hypothetical protein
MDTMTSIIQRAAKALTNLRPNKLLAVLTGCFLLAGIPVFAQQLAISGTVRDAMGLCPQWT